MFVLFFYVFMYSCDNGRIEPIQKVEFFTYTNVKMGSWVPRRDRLYKPVKYLASGVTGTISGQGAMKMSVVQRQEHTRIHWTKQTQRKRNCLVRGARKDSYYEGK